MNKLIEKRNPNVVDYGYNNMANDFYAQNFPNTLNQNGQNYPQQEMGFSNYDYNQGMMQNINYAAQNQMVQPVAQPSYQNVPNNQQPYYDNNYQYGYNQNVYAQNNQQNYQQAYPMSNQQAQNISYPTFNSNQGYGVEYKAQVGKKQRVNIKAKLLIAVYFLILTVVATLLLVNFFGSNNAQAIEAGQEQTQVEVTSSAYDLDGNKMELKEIPPIINYEYEEQTNWFDKLCDNISNLFG